MNLIRNEAYNADIWVKPKTYTRKEGDINIIRGKYGSRERDNQ